MSRKGDIVKKLLLIANFPIWRRERQKYEVAKLKFGKSIEIYKVTNFQNFQKTFQVKLLNDCTNISV
jgi:hypothetical protein